jgi:hypothetical protein
MTLKNKNPIACLVPGRTSKKKIPFGNLKALEEACVEIASPIGRPSVFFSGLTVQKMNRFYCHAGQNQRRDDSNQIKLRVLQDGHSFLFPSRLQSCLRV